MLGAEEKAGKGRVRTNRTSPEAAIQRELSHLKVGLVVLREVFCVLVRGGQDLSKERGQHPSDSSSGLERLPREERRQYGIIWEVLRNSQSLKPHLPVAEQLQQ